jgi:hypothetical protein
MSLPADSLLAITGIFPDAITAREHQASQALPAILGKRARAWVKNEEQADFVYIEPKKDIEKVFAQLAIEPSEPQVSAWIEGLDVEDPELQADYFMALMKAREHLVNSWPKYSLTGPAGSKVLPLSFDDAAEMWSLIHVMDDVERIFDEMDSRTLTPTQALAFRECYPDLYQICTDAIEAELVERRAKDEEFDLGWEREALLNTLRGAPPEQVTMPPPKPPAPEPNLKLDPKRERTQEEVSSAPKQK